jgi:hypothetical protein
VLTEIADTDTDAPGNPIVTLPSCRGLASATPSLTHLAEQLLGKQLRGGTSSSTSSQQQQQPHDSVEDASAALALVKVELERLRSEEGPTPPLPPPAVKVRHLQMICFFHRAEKQYQWPSRFKDIVCCLLSCSKRLGYFRWSCAADDSPC